MARALVPTVCPYCAAGCGFFIAVQKGRASGIEYMPDHPASEGALCSKGNAALEILDHPDRLRTPLRRKGDDWERISWEQALDEIADLLERTPSLGHIILDEAQDLSPMQLRAVGRRASTGSLTVLGDLAQGTTPWATRSWDESLEHLGKRGAHLEELTRGFRVPAAVLEYAARLLPRIAPELALPESVRSNPGRLDVVAAGGRLLPAVVSAVGSALEGAPGTVGVIVADDSVAATAGVLDDAGLEHVRLGGASSGLAEPDRPGPRVELVPATLAKGLEFDQVVVVEPAAIAAAEPDERTGLRRLYVVLTRAVSGLTVVHDRPLPPELVTVPA